MVSSGRAKIEEFVQTLGKGKRPPSPPPTAPGQGEEVKKAKGPVLDLQRLSTCPWLEVPELVDKYLKLTSSKLTYSQQTHLKALIASAMSCSELLGQGNVPSAVQKEGEVYASRERLSGAREVLVSVVELLCTRLGAQVRAVVAAQLSEARNMGKSVAAQQVEEASVAQPTSKTVAQPEPTSKATTTQPASKAKALPQVCRVAHAHTSKLQVEFDVPNQQRPSRGRPVKPAKVNAAPESEHGATPASEQAPGGDRVPDLEEPGAQEPPVVDLGDCSPCSDRTLIQDSPEVTLAQVRGVLLSGLEKVEGFCSELRELRHPSLSPGLLELAQELETRLRGELQKIGSL